MNVSQLNHERLTVPVAAAWVIGAAGLLAIFATYWDEAWHTDIGRDSAWALPHVLLYASVAVVGLGVAAWGLRVWWLTRSLSRALRQRALFVSGLGGIGALVSAPIDALWHERYGRDAVLWSPPHMLVLFAATALTMGVLAALPWRAHTAKALICVLLTGNAVAVVFEYEADVPQFTEVLYLPVLLLAGLFVVWMTRRSLPLRVPVTSVVLGYAALRFAILVALGALGRSTPDWPIAVLGLAVVDIPFRTPAQRYTAGIGAVAALAWVASLTGAASPAPGSVAVTAVPLILAALLILLASWRWGQVQTVLPIGIAVAAVALSLGWPADRAAAHDPGQGERVTDVELSISSQGNGALTLRVRALDGCSDLTPTGVVARRAGATVRGPLRAVGPCTFEGTVDVEAHGRWFAYVEMSHETERVEAWLPVYADRKQSVTRTRELYLPPSTDPAGRTDQVVLGALIYLLGAALLVGGVLAARRPFELQTS